MCICEKCIPTLALRISKVQEVRHYSLCCPPSRGPCGCSGRGSGQRVEPPAHCRPGPIPYNPCVPRFHPHNDSWKKYKYFTLFVMLPIILIQMMRTLGNEPPHKEECRDYEYMRLRSKKFPWGDGVKSLFHNPHVNHLPGECVPPPLDCD